MTKNTASGQAPAVSPKLDNGVSTNSENHTSLLGYEINYGRKNFILQAPA